MVDFALVHLRRDATAYAGLEVPGVLGDERRYSQAVYGNGATGRRPMIVGHAVPVARMGSC